VLSVYLVWVGFFFISKWYGCSSIPLWAVMPNSLGWRWSYGSLINNYLCMQPVPITPKVVSSSPVHGEVYSIQYYKKLTSELLKSDFDHLSYIIYITNIWLTHQFSIFRCGTIQQMFLSKYLQKGGWNKRVHWSKLFLFNDVYWWRLPGAQGSNPQTVVQCLPVDHSGEFTPQKFGYWACFYYLIDN
jgi:hypothetical protein